MSNHCNEHVLKALKIASDLMELANSGGTLRDDIGWGILSGVMRDCAYKIRREAEREAHKAKGQWGSHTSEIQQKSEKSGPTLASFG